MKRESLIEMKVEPKNYSNQTNEEENTSDSTLKAYLREISNYPQLS